MINVHSSPGHGMIIDGGINVDAHWGRRLMALAQNNETVEKNCTEPGRRGHIITVLETQNLGEVKHFIGSQHCWCFFVV